MLFSLNSTSIEGKKDFTFLFFIYSPIFIEPINYGLDWSL